MGTLGVAALDSVLNEAARSPELSAVGYGLIISSAGEGRGRVSGSGATGLVGQGGYEEALVSALEAVATSPPRSPCKGGASSSPRRSRQQDWELPALLGAAAHHRELCGPDPAALQNALGVLSGGRSKMPREMLISRAGGFEKEGGLSVEDVEDLLQLCSAPAAAEAVEVGPLLQAMVSKICQPKARPRRPVRRTA